MADMEKKRIEQIIVVEGRDDTAAILRSVDYETAGIIIFTDPDTAGEQIRRRLAERYPKAEHAFLDRSQAEKDGDIGIENASPESIREALAKAHRPASADRPAQETGSVDAFTRDDLINIAVGADGKRLDNAEFRYILGKCI